MRPYRAILFILAATAVAWIGFSGLTKLLDLPSFRESLRTWTVVPPLAAAVATVLVPPLEFLLAALWAFRIKTIAVGASLIVLVTAITFVLAAQTIVGRPFACGCNTYFSLRPASEPTWLPIIANVSIVSILVLNLLVERRQRTAQR